MRIENGIALITGAASGIGASLAQQLAAKGCNLALVDKDAAGLAAIAQQLGPHGVKVSTHLCDLADRPSLQALPVAVLAEHERINMLINNAGVALVGHTEHVSIADIEWVIAINMAAPIYLCKAFLPILQAQSAAHIVNVSSIFGIIAPAAQAAYSASKFGLRGFSEALRHELAPTQIGLTVVHPGGVRTNIARSARLPKAMDLPEVRQRMEKFNKALRTLPDNAASQIVRAIEKRQSRLLIGEDARAADRIQRLLPSSYWSIISKFITH